MAQWESGSLITFKMFPRYYPRLPHTGEKHQITFASSQSSFTSLIYIVSELRPMLNSVPCRISKFINSKTPHFFWFKNLWFLASVRGNKFSTILVDLVNEVAISREVKVKGGPMRGGYSTSSDAENDFILNSHVLAKLRKELKNKMNFEADSNHKEWTAREIKKQEENIAGLIGSLNHYGNPFHRVARNMATGTEIPGNTINGLLSTRKYGTERVEQSIKKILLIREVFMTLYNAVL